MKMNNNVFLVRNVAEGNFGGGEIYQLKLAKELKKNGYMPIILTNSKELLKNAKENDYLTLIPPYSKRQNWSGWRNLLLFRYLVFQKKLTKWYEKAIIDYKPVVVNIQSRDDMIAGTIAARNAGVRVLWTDHADFRNWVLWNVNMKFKNLIGKVIVALSKEVDAVILVGKTVAEETQKMIKPMKIDHVKVIVNGVEDKLSDYRSVRGGKQSFVFIGRVTEEKGIGELIKAFLMVAVKYPTAELNIYGNGEDLEKYKDLVGENRMIRFYGQTDKPLQALAENEIFVLPSYMEGLSLSLLDAAMMKKKIIASNIDENSEVVVNKKTGLLVPVKDVDKLAEAMIWMLENKKEAKEMANNVRQRYEERFNFEKIFTEQMLPLYKTLEGDG